MMTVLPAAIAPITGPNVSWKGKLKVLDEVVTSHEILWRFNLCVEEQNLPDYQDAAEGVLPDLRTHQLKR